MQQPLRPLLNPERKSELETSTQAQNLTDVNANNIFSDEPHCHHTETPVLSIGRKLEMYWGVCRALEYAVISKHPCVFRLTNLQV